MKKSLVLALLALIAACSASSNSSLSLSARAGGVSTTTTTPAATGISVSRIRIALREIELRSRDGSKRAEIEVGPVLIDLGAADLSGGVHKVLDSSVPAGTYDKIEFKIHTLESSISASGADDLVRARASILVDGTFNTKAFQFASAVEAEQELEGSFVIDAKSQNITIDIDPTGWFLSGTTVLDPADPANRPAIEANIARSLAAFQDDDESGHENHHGDDDADGGHDDDADGGRGGDGGHGGDDGPGHH
jgi:hypothetical protein